MEKVKAEELLQLFQSFITTIERRKLTNWRVRKLTDKSLEIRCTTGTRYPVEVPVAIGILTMFNSINKETTITEVRRDFYEKDERFTEVVWELKIQEAS